jgi:hypothetical protein
MLSIDMEEDECSLRARLSAPSRSKGESALRFLPALEEPPELWADLTRDHESNEISVTMLAFGQCVRA